MARFMCIKCKKGHVSCQCSTTCKQCLTLGTLGDNGTCNCCKKCGAAQVTCEADGNCSEYEASGAVPQHPCSTPPPPTHNVPPATTHAQQPTAFQQQKPPDLNMVFKDPFPFSKRTDIMDIVTYVNKVEINFLEKLQEINISEFYWALLWIGS